MITPNQHSASVIVTSDTCVLDPSQDTSGQYVVDNLRSLNFHVTRHIVADDKEAITERVRKCLDVDTNALIITVGGTGLCPRDVTPEATSALYDRHCNGIATALLLTSLRYSPHAALSRLTAGISGSCLIINFPGKLKACKECFACLEGFLGHALDQVRFNAEAIKSTHREQEAVRKELERIELADTLAQDLLPKDILHILTPPKSPEKSSNTAANMHVVADVQALRPNVVDSPTTIEDAPLVDIVSEPPEIKVPATISSPYPCIEYANALEIMRSLSRTLARESVTIALASLESSHQVLGDVIAVDLPSNARIPPFPVSTMDGYVLNIPKRLKKFMSKIKSAEATLVNNLEEFEQLQRDPTASCSFFCYQVNTGGRVPEGDDFAVIPFEMTGPSSTKNTVPILDIELGRYVRLPGSDLDHDDSLKAGTIIGPVELAIIQSMGVKNVKVIKKPVLGVLSTGDELVEPFNYDGSDINKVVNTNGPLLTSLFKIKGYPVVNCGISRDNPTDILLNIEISLEKCDILIITGGASMGSKDCVKSVIEQIGGIVHFGRVNIKPGKPAGLASLVRAGKRMFVFSLPGNPVSAYITSLVLVLPFIEHGMRNHLGTNSSLTLNDIGDLITVEIVTITDLDSNDRPYEFDGRLEFARATLLPSRDIRLNLPVSVSVKQQSSRMLSLRNCDCLIIIDPSLKGSRFQEGQIYQALRVKK